MKWRCLASQQRKGSRRRSEAEQKLTAAYRDVFMRADESTELVLSDLANFCGFYKVPPIGSPPETLLVDQGMRSAFGRIFHFLSMPEEKLKALEEAARREAVADEEEGIF